ncbi:alpha/beta hydrolase family protein [Actinoplanes sp. NPDC051346]|uniref:alpha/beta fold hydrolase n=1 Tax=Actinoplanes sp. NPDC051346 TaxID=3155048 RepID=UPI003439561F
MAAHVRAGEAPPVVFISQLDSGADVWEPVPGKLSTGVTTVTYDRPGTGGAPPRRALYQPLPHSAFAGELADLLDEAAVTEPAIIVGHSFGGNIARLFADRHPARVAGMVYIDCSIPRQRLWDGLTPIKDGGTPLDMVVGEVEVLRAVPPAVPSIVVASEAHRWNEPLPHPAITDLWETYQQILARRSGAPLIIAEGVGHQIPADAPELVAHCVDAVVRAVRAGLPLAVDAVELAALGGRLTTPGR